MRSKIVRSLELKLKQLNSEEKAKEDSFMRDVLTLSDSLNFNVKSFSDCHCFKIDLEYEGRLVYHCDSFEAAYNFLWGWHKCQEAVAKDLTRMY